MPVQEVQKALGIADLDAPLLAVGVEDLRFFWHGKGMLAVGVWRTCVTKRVQHGQRGSVSPPVLPQAPSSNQN